MDYRNNMDAYYGDVGNYSTTAFTQRAKEIITNHDQSNPMFMYLSYQAPHTPLQVANLIETIYICACVCCVCRCVCVRVCVCVCVRMCVCASVDYKIIFNAHFKTLYY